MAQLINSWRRFMADQQHRATAQQWRDVKAMAFGSLACSTILELLHRVEALEASQSGSIDLSHLSDAERERILKQIANPGRFEVLEVAQPAKPNYPEKPDSSLLSQVAAVIGNGTACDRAPERIARDTIREVAAWLSEHAGGTDSPLLLEREAER
jgi:hypothetical protein